MSANARVLPRGRLKRLARPAVAILLLALVAMWAGPEQLRQQLAGVVPGWFVAAVLVAIASNVLSALRWTMLARALGLHAPVVPLVSAYAQGIAVNVVVPGATLGGDALRALRLTRLGNEAGASLLSVLLDRASGLWVLCVLSLAVTGAWLVLAPDARALLVANGLLWYVAALLAAVTAPWWPVHLRGHFTGWRQRLASQLRDWRTMIHTRRGALARSLVPSLGVQVLSATALWLCAQAAGSTVGYGPVLAVAAPVFIAAAIPVSIGGFGPREFAATLAFPLIGASAADGAAAAMLYGLTGVVQGILGAPLIVWNPQNDGPR